LAKSATTRHGIRADNCSRWLPLRRQPHRPTVSSIALFVLGMPRARPETMIRDLRDRASDVAEQTEPLVVGFPRRLRPPLRWPALVGSILFRQASTLLGGSCWSSCSITYFTADSQLWDRFATPGAMRSSMKKYKAGDNGTMHHSRATRSRRT